MKCVHSSIARADLLDIWGYIYDESKSESTANKVIDQIRNQEKFLVNYPNIGKRRDDLEKGIRNTQAGRYLIFYQVYEKEIAIFRILQSSREITRNLFS